MLARKGNSEGIRVMRVIGAAGLVAVMALGACDRGETMVTRGPAPLTATVATGGPIRAACLRSDRPAASGLLCGCIQSVADRTLTPAQQKRGAGWFADPHEAQEVRQSDRSGDEAMWQAWKAFADTAEQSCRPFG